eukprot:scaffold70081_cov69-Cyclotella_meneghiniana.AAC.1
MGRYSGIFRPVPVPERGRVGCRVYPITLRSSQVGSAPTKYPYPKAFYPGIGCRMWGVWGCNVPDSIVIVRRGWGAVPQSFLGDRQTMYLFTDRMVLQEEMAVKYSCPYYCSANVWTRNKGGAYF